MGLEIDDQNTHEASCQRIITNSVTQTQEKSAFTFLTNKKPGPTDNQRLRIENSKKLLEQHQIFFKSFVSTYKETVTKDEVRAITLEKINQVPLSQDEIFNQTQALIKFIYRHFHYLSNLKEIKKMIVSSLSTTASCEHFFDLKFEEKMKNSMSRLRNRHLDIQKELFDIQIDNIKLLPPKFEVDSLKRVFIMNGQLEPYMKSVSVNDHDNFAVFFYSEHTLNEIKSQTYDHIFIDGTKSSLPFS